MYLQKILSLIMLSNINYVNAYKMIPKLKILNMLVQQNH